MDHSRRSALIVDADAKVRRLVRQLLHKLGCEVVEVEDGGDALAQLSLGHFDLVVADLHTSLADDTRLLTAIRAGHPQTPTITLTAEGSLSECVSAIRAGAADCLVKPIHGDALEGVLRQQLGELARTSPRHAPSPPRVDECPLVGESRLMQELLRTVARVARTDASVLITGETGTGKDVLARLVHELSPRARGPLVVVSCGAIPEGMIERELFGHAPGAFPGADEARVGLIAQASGGTLVLDELGELPLAAQARLLHVLEERAVAPVGAIFPTPVDVRVVAVTHRDLDALRAVGKFRDDLFFRVDVVRVEIPPLRAHREDIVALARHFLARAAQRAGRELELGREALEALVFYAWPGNVRELENTIERMAILATGPTLGPELLPERLRASVTTPAAAAAAAAAFPAQGLDLHTALHRIEQRLIGEALRRANGCRSEAARLLKLNRTTLLERMKRGTLN